MRIGVADDEVEDECVYELRQLCKSKALVAQKEETPDRRGSAIGFMDKFIKKESLACPGADTFR